MTYYRAEYKSLENPLRIYMKLRLSRSISTFSGVHSFQPHCGHVLGLLLVEQGGRSSKGKVKYHESIN